MSLGVTTSMKQMCVQQTLKARFIVHQAQESWQQARIQDFLTGGVDCRGSLPFPSPSPPFPFTPLPPPLPFPLPPSLPLEVGPLKSS